MSHKNNKNSNDFYSEFFFIITGAVIGYLCFVVMQNYSDWFALPFFIFDMAFILIAVHVIRNRYRRFTQGLIRELYQNVRKISTGEEMDAPVDGFFLSETAELYKAIEQLNMSLLSQSQSKDNVIGIINSIALNIELEKLLDDMLPKIIEGTGSNWGAFYLYNSQTEKMELKCSVGFANSVYQEFDVALGEGFVGRSALTDKINIFNNIPDDTIYISKTFLGKIKPRSVMTVPISSEGENVAIMLLASIYDYNDEQLEIVKLIRYYMGSAVTNGLTFERTKRLKNELLFQNQLIQNMNEELENKVVERTQFLNNVLNSIVDYAIIAMDEDGLITMWNKGAETIRGFKAGDVLGKHITETYLEGNLNEFEKNFEIVKINGKREEYKWLIRTNGESLYAHRIITAIRDANGELKGFASLTRDITSHKRLEDRAASTRQLCDLLVSGSREGVLIIDNNGLVTAANAKAAEICCILPEKLVGVPFGSLLSDSKTFKRKLEELAGSSVTETWQARLEAGGEAVDIEISMAGTDAHDSSERVVAAYIKKIS